MKPLETAIAEHPFGKGLRPPHLKAITECAMRSHFDAGEAIFQEGEMANRFYLIQKGKVALFASEHGQPHHIQTIGAGDVLGWSWLFPPYYWHFYAQAVEATDAIFFYGTRLREECEQDQGLGYELMKRMAEIIIQRLQSTRRQLVEATRGRPNYSADLLAKPNS